MSPINSENDIWERPLIDLILVLPTCDLTKKIVRKFLPVEVRVYPLGFGFFRLRIFTMIISTKTNTKMATPKTI